MNNTLALSLLFLHVLVCFVLWLLVHCGILDIKGYFFPVALLIPVWGPLCVVVLHTSRALFGDTLLDQTLEKLHINEAIHKSILVPGNTDDEQVVPLEEALLVNDAAQKRQLILSVLTEDPASYYDLLQQARLNDDSEVVHYASTALAQISTEADLTLQKYEQQYAAAPDDAEMLCSYSDYLETYISSGFVQGRAAEIQQHQLEQLLKKRIDSRRDFTLECKLAAVQLDLAEYEDARRTLAALAERWPQREEPWLLQIRMAALLHDGTAVQEILHKIRVQDVYLSSKGQEIVNFWNGKEDHK